MGTPAMKAGLQHYALHPQGSLYLKKEGQLLYPLDGGKEEVEMIKVELGSYAFAAQY